MSYYYNIAHDSQSHYIGLSVSRGSIRLLVDHISLTIIHSRAGEYCNFSARYLIEKAAILLFIAIFTKACWLTVLLGCFDLFIDLVLQVPGFCLL